MMMAEVPISWPSPPRPEDYVVVPGSQGPRLDFRISVGLREGWDAECIAGDTWPGVLATTLRSERTSGLGVPAGTWTQ
jgi:hypothetical protein